MKKFIRWDNTKKYYAEDIVTWNDIDLSSFNIHDILRDRKPNTILAIDNNNNFVYLPKDELSSRNIYNNVLGEVSLLNAIAGETITITHFKDMFNLRSAEIYKVYDESISENLLDNYTVISGTYQNPIILDPSQSITFYVSLDVFNKSDFNISIDNTLVDVQIYFSYDNVTYYTISDTSNIIYANIVTDQGMTIDTLNNNFDSIIKGQEQLFLVFKLTNNLLESQTITNIQLSYKNISKELLNSNYYDVKFISPSTTTIIFNSNINDKLLIRVTAPIFKDTKDIVLNGLETKTITYPIDLTSAVITVLELLSSTTGSTKTLRIEFDDPDKYIYDPTTTTIVNGSIKFKTFYTNNLVPYITDKTITVISSGYYDLHFLNKLNTIKVLMDNNNPYIECKISLTFDDGLTWIGLDSTNNSFISITLDEIITKGIPVDLLDQIPIDLLTSYGKIFNVAVSFRTLDRSNSDNVYIDTTFTTSSLNVIKDTDGSIKHSVPTPTLYGHLITITNPNNEPVNNYPILIDLSPLGSIPTSFYIIDTKTNDIVYYYFSDDKYRYKQTLDTTQNKIVLIIPELNANETRTYKIIPSDKTSSIHPKDILEYYVDPSMGYVIQSPTLYTIENDGFHIYTDNGAIWLYLPRTSDMFNKEMIIHWRQHPLYSWWNVTALYLYTEDYRLIRDYHHQRGLLYNIPWSSRFDSTVDQLSHISERITVKFTSVSNIDLIIENLDNGLVYSITEDVSTDTSLTPTSLRLLPRLYLSDEDTPVGVVLENIIIRQAIDLPLEVNVSYVPYPEPEEVEIVLNNSINLDYITNVDEYNIKLNVKYADVDYLGYLVSPDGITWYYYDTATNTYVNQTSPDQFIDIYSGISASTFKTQFSTSIMYIKIVGRSYEFILLPYIIFYGFPKHTFFSIDDIIIEYNVNAHFEIASDVFLAIQDSNILVLKNESNDVKHLKVNVIG